MRNTIRTNTRINVLGRRQERNVVIGHGVMRHVPYAQPMFGQFYQAMAGCKAALARLLKPAAAGTARLLDSSAVALDASLARLSWQGHSHRAKPCHAVVRVGS